MLKSAWSGLRCWRPRFLDSAPSMGDAGVETVRQAMRELVQAAPGAASARLMGSIERAHDVRTLWFLRSPLMQALSSNRGELGAREAVAELDQLFREGWPDAPVSRFPVLE